MWFVGEFVVPSCRLPCGDRTPISSRPLYYANPDLHIPVHLPLGHRLDNGTGCRCTGDDSAGDRYTNPPPPRRRLRHGLSGREHAGVVRVFMEAGFEVDVRPILPGDGGAGRLDLRRYRADGRRRPGDEQPGSRPGHQLRVPRKSADPSRSLQTDPTGRGEGPILACMTGTSSTRCSTV